IDTYQRDALGFVTKAVLGGNTARPRASRYVTDHEGRVTAASDPMGMLVKSRYDERGLLVPRARSLSGIHGPGLRAVRPSERAPPFVVPEHVGVDLVLEFILRGERPAREDVPVQDGERALDLVQPGGVLRGQVHRPTRVRLEPVEGVVGQVHR